MDEAGLGGGMYLRNLSAAAVVSGNTVADGNRASYSVYGEGGGIHLDECWATVTGNQIFGNTAASSNEGWGGGVYVRGGGGLLQGNIITGNLAMLGAAGGNGWGSGIAITNSVGVTTDIDGDPRPDSCSPDIGADELSTGWACRRVYLPVVMRN